MSSSYSLHGWEALPALVVDGSDMPSSVSTNEDFVTADPKRILNGGPFLHLVSGGSKMLSSVRTNEDFLAVYPIRISHVGPLSHLVSDGSNMISSVGTNDDFVAVDPMRISHSGGAFDGSNMLSSVSTKKDFVAVDPALISRRRPRLNTHFHSEMRPRPVRDTFVANHSSGPTSGFSSNYNPQLQKDLFGSVSGNISSQSNDISHGYLAHNNSSRNHLLSSTNSSGASFGLLFDASCFSCDKVKRMFNCNAPEEMPYDRSVLSSGQGGRFALGSANPQVTSLQNGYKFERILRFQRFVVFHEIFKAKNGNNPRLLDKFFNAIHGKYYYRGKSCDCFTLRKCIIHYSVCKSSSCAFCIPIRSRSCMCKSDGPEKYFSRHGSLRGNTDQKAQSATTPTHLNLGNSEMHDDWSISAVVHQRCRPPDGNSSSNQNRMAMNGEQLILKEAATAAQERAAHAENGESMLANIFSNKQPEKLVTYASQWRNSEIHDDWSISAVVHQKCRPPDVNSSSNQTEMAMNKEQLFFKEAETAAQERGAAHAENDELMCVTIFSNKMTENLVTDASDGSCIRSNEIQCSPEIIQENPGAQMDPSLREKIGNDDVSCQLVSGHADVNDAESENLKSGEAYTIHEKLFSGIWDKSKPMNDFMDYEMREGAESIPQSEKTLEELKYYGVSMTDFLLEEDIEEYLDSMNQFTGMESQRNMNMDDCQLCGMRLLQFHAPPKSCAICSGLIKHGSKYYSADGNAGKLCFCGSCFLKCPGRNILIGGLSFSKLDFQKLKHTEEFEEAWVRCDKCDCWQHQICGLYNSKQKFEEKTKYICPFCQLAAMKIKDSSSSPVVCGAQSLPRTKLSDHLERRLFRSLEQERKQRSEFSGKQLDEVPGARKLTVRVVSASSKVLKVNQQFLDLVDGEKYPVEFPYKSKVILLFQKLGGIDVCLFAMYVQEYGSDCRDPNMRAVYISYLDSVKYFEPDIRTATGAALRTFVYHEILIGYLDYCKQRGFTTCYIWACPPSKSEDYILYCHPETQKRPSPVNLIQWYNKMIHKAIGDGIVVESSNFYDYMFNPKDEHSSKYSATRLPYFDGDYCSSVVDDILLTIEKETKGDYKKCLLKQMRQKELNSMGIGDLSVDTAKEILYMQKLEKKISSAKEQFLVLQLQYTCTECHEPILSESRWDCKQCKKLHICSRCLKREDFFRGKATHTNKKGHKHILHEVSVNLPADTEDNDTILENELFDSRHSFLEFCKTNFCMFDTLRRAKFSSMLILHNLMTASASKDIICSSCHSNLVQSLFGNKTTAFSFCQSCSEKYTLGSTKLTDTERTKATTAKRAAESSDVDDRVRKIRRVEVEQEKVSPNPQQRPPTRKRSKRKRGLKSSWTCLLSRPDSTRMRRCYFSITPPI